MLTASAAKPEPIGPLNLSRTAAALAALDRVSAFIDTGIDDLGTLADALDSEESARKALGEAFALDTADRNRPEDAAAWARHRPEDMRRLVAAFPPPAHA